MAIPPFSRVPDLPPKDGTKDLKSAAQGETAGTPGQNNTGRIGIQRRSQSGITLLNMGNRIDKKNYEIKFSNWWKSMPYGFRYVPRDRGKPLIFFLPLNPSGISVKTPFATNIVSTMYGTVEEHSEVRYHDIVISGTTGISPRYSQIFKEGKGLNPTEQIQRLSYGTTGQFTDFLKGGSGYFKSAIEQAKNIANQVDSIVEVFKGQQVSSGVKQALSGHAAFHNFFRFLLEYKRDTSGLDRQTQRPSHPLQFLNYKDNIQYDCVVRDFSWTKNAQDPMLYNYSIVLRCYNLKTLQKGPSVDNITQRYEQLGLNGISTSSYAALASRALRAAKNVVHQLAANAGGF